MSTRKGSDVDPEIFAISQVYTALHDLPVDAQQRVMDYVARKLELTASAGHRAARDKEELQDSVDSLPPTVSGDESAREGSRDDSLEGISPAAVKWMKRSGFTSDQLSKLFSLGIDEIDLVAKKVPGKSMRDKTRSVILLKGIASYLGTGVPRVTYEQIKEASQHYGAFDNTNFAKYVKTMAADVSGTKESGFTVTARGLTEATELVRDLISEKG